MSTSPIPSPWENAALPSLLSRAQALLEKQEAFGSVGSIPILPPAVADLIGKLVGGSNDKGDARDQLLKIVESLLTEVSRERGQATTPYDDRVSLIHCMAPARAGSDALTTLRVVNEESTPIEIAIYTTNFVADCGYEISSLHVRADPRVVTIAPGAELDLTIRVTVPQQAPAGVYSGLVQATGHRYVKAVVSLQVL